MIASDEPHDQPPTDTREADFVADFLHQTNAQ